jgi:hypothetical protein
VSEKSNDNKESWQYKYITDIFNIAKRNNKTKIDLLDPIYSDAISNKPKLPKLLYKFYRPTIDNVYDVFNKRLYLADPKDFNDIFDSNLGIDERLYKKMSILNYIKANRKRYGFFNEESYNKLNSEPADSFNKLYHEMSPSDEISFWDRLGPLLHAKSEYTNKKELFDECIKKSHSKRIACFMEDEDDIIFSYTPMWAHYADNGKGFCVEYDMEKTNDIDFLKSVFSKNETDSILYSKKLNHSLLPVAYSSSRVDLPIKFFNEMSNEEYQVEIEKAVLLSCISKSNLWSAEKEYRLILNADDDIFHENLYENKISFPFIKTIYLGYNMEESIKKLFYHFAKKNTRLVRQPII